MFGETDFIGSFEQTIEGKGRIVIPSILAAEPGEKVGLAFGSDYKHLLLMTLKAYKELYHRIVLANNREILDQDPKLVEKMRRLIGTVDVDSQHRIQIPRYALQRTGLEGDIVMVGQITCIGVYPRK